MRAVWISKLYSLAKAEKKYATTVNMDELQKLLPGVREHESMTAHTTFKIGGTARYFFVAQSSSDVARAVAAATECNVPFFALGGGSNILVSDKGFEGLVILNNIPGFTVQVDGVVATVVVGAGENWDETVARCVQENWAGIESLSGIPGTVGASPVQNIGAYGQSVGAVIKEVRAFDCVVQKEVIFNNSACQFSYRESIFKKETGRFIITQVTFTLAVHGMPTLTYHDLKNYFPAHAAPTIAEVRAAVIEIRSRKGYLIMPGHESYATAGSFFKNPIVEGNQFQRVKDSVRGCADPWYWALPNGSVKVAAACLLQNSGFPKGYRKGNVGISPKHSLSLMNYGGACATEISALAEEIKKSVQEKCGIALQTEVELVGFS